MGSGLVDLLELKRELRRELESRLSPRERKEALMDSHARREPRMCGLTVHPGRGCSFGCRYCYIEDMGFTGPPTVSNLSGLQLAYALLSNPYFLPSREGTLLAFGSVTEPFLPKVRERTLEYLRTVRELLGNPAQVSTKCYLNQEDSFKLVEADPGLSVLVTIPTMDRASEVEPLAPKPELRFLTMRNLSRLVHVALFLRPLIPGIAEEEGPRILEIAKESGARGVVFGTLRVTPRIMERMRGIGIRHLEDLLSDRNLRSGRQVPIDASLTKSLLTRMAAGLGLRVFPAACSANIEAHSLGCRACDLGPCGGEPPASDARDLEEGLRLCGIDAEVVGIGGRLEVILRDGVRKEKIARHLVSTASRRKVVIRRNP